MQAGSLNISPYVVKWHSTMPGWHSHRHTFAPSSRAGACKKSPQWSHGLLLGDTPPAANRLPLPLTAVSVSRGGSCGLHTPSGCGRWAHQHQWQHPSLQVAARHDKWSVLTLLMPAADLRMCTSWPTDALAFSCLQYASAGSLVKQQCVMRQHPVQLRFYPPTPEADACRRLLALRAAQPNGKLPL